MNLSEQSLSESLRHYRHTMIGIDKRESLINFESGIKVILNPNNHGFSCLKKYENAKNREMVVMTINEKTGVIRCADNLSGNILIYHYQNLLIID